MEVKSIVAYEGPNIHAHFTVIRYTVDLGVLEEWPTGRLGQRFIDGCSAICRALHSMAARISPPADSCGA